MMVKAVLFDLDQTLLNRVASVEKFVSCQHDRLYEFLGHIEKETYCRRFVELDNNGYVWKDKVYGELVREFNIRAISAEDLLVDYLREFKHACVAFPSLIAMLAELKERKVKLGIITNGYGTFQMDNIIALGIKGYFDCLLISEWEGVKKPAPEIFNKALHQLNVAPNEAVFVGDHPVNDVLAAQKVGMVGIWKENKLFRSEGADFIISDLDELPAIIRNLQS